MNHRLTLPRSSFLSPSAHRHVRPYYNNAKRDDSRESSHFNRVTNEDGESYYYPKRPSERRQPRQLEPNEIFQMPNLILDLDAAPPTQVREYVPGEEADDLDPVNRFSQRHLRTRQKVQEMRSLLHQSRKVAPNAAGSSVNPWQVTRHDILSVALRGILREEASAPHTRVASATSSTTDAGNTKSTYRVVKLTQNHEEKDSFRLIPTKRSIIDENELSTQHDSNLERPKYALTAADYPIRPDFTKEVLLSNGIPSHALKSETSLIRWMMVRQEAATSVRERIATYHQEYESEPASQDFSGPLGAQQSISGLRRLVFQCREAGMITEKNHPRLIRDACVRIMTREDTEECYRETLIFINNLSQAVKTRTPDFEACVLAIRLRCLAAMGKLNLTAQFLEESAARIVHTLTSTNANMEADVCATLEKWLLQLEDSDDLDSASQRQRLLLVVAGNGHHPESLRLIMSHFRHGGRCAQALRPYLALLGRLGATRTLWMEWTELVHDVAAHDKDGADAVATHFLSTLMDGVRISKGIGAGQNSSEEMQELAACVMLDSQFIQRRVKSVSAEEGSAPAETPTVSFPVLDEMMRLPYEKSMMKVLEYAQRS